MSQINLHRVRDTKLLYVLPLIIDSLVIIVLSLNLIFLILIGALCDALNLFKVQSINLTKIDSRPNPAKQWHYYFFIEFEGHMDDAVGVLEGLKEFCLEVKVLGSYSDEKS